MYAFFEHHSQGALDLRAAAAKGEGNNQRDPRAIHKQMIRGKCGQAEKVLPYFR